VPKAAVQGGAKSKFWLRPVALASNFACDARTLRELEAMVEETCLASRGYGMSISAKALRFDDDNMWVELMDGRTLGIPLAWFPRLLHASPEQRGGYEIIHDGRHWDALDEDISIPGLLAGHGDLTRRRSLAAE
jgi:hypothetical protein